MTRKQQVIDTFRSLNGKSFTSRGDLDDAFYPAFGTLTAVFPGEGHRDTVDRLLYMKWINETSSGFTVNIPEAV